MNKTRFTTLELLLLLYGATTAKNNDIVEVKFFNEYCHRYGIVVTKIYQQLELMNKCKGIHELVQFHMKNGAISALSITTSGLEAIKKYTLLPDTYKLFVRSRLAYKDLHMLLNTMMYCSSILKYKSSYSFSKSARMHLSVVRRWIRLYEEFSKRNVVEV